MKTSDDEEAMPLISEPDIVTSSRDTRKSDEERLAVNLILASTLFERIAFYTISTNLILSLESETPLNQNTKTSTVASLMFSGISYISTLLFAILSDAKLHRFKTIMIGFVVYFIGYVLAILITTNDVRMCTTGMSNDSNISIPYSILDEPCSGWVVTTLIIIAIGAGAIQSNMPVFGAEQVRQTHSVSGYFDKHVVAINISAIFAQLIMSYIQDVDRSKIFLRYTIAASMLVLSAILFFIGRRYYIHIEPYDSVVSNCIPVVKNAFHAWRDYKKKRRFLEKEQKTITRLNSSYESTEEEQSQSIDIDERSRSFLDYAKIVNHGQFSDRIVDDVKSLRIPFIVFSLFIPYWLIYDQFNTTFSAQRQYMAMGQNNQYPTLISTSISFGDSGTIIIGLLIFHVFFRKYLDAQNRSSVLVTRFVVGMCFACLSMCTSGIVEGVRQQQCKRDLEDSNLPIYAQLPQNILLGLSELFLMVASFEFAYFASRRSARSLFMSLRFFSIGVSSFIGVFYVHIFPSTIVNLNFICKTNYEWYWSFYTYFFILGGIQFIFIIVFILCQRRFHIVKLESQ